jgi:acyl homoserine lactone synthase
LVWTRHTSSGSDERLADLRLESNRFFAQITIRAPAQLRSGIMKLIAIQAPTSSKDAALLASARTGSPETSPDPMVGSAINSTKSNRPIFLPYRIGDIDVVIGCARLLPANDLTMLSPGRLDAHPS